MKRSKPNNLIIFFFLILPIAFIHFNNCNLEKKEYNFQKVDELVKSGINDSVFPGAVVLFGN